MAHGTWAQHWTQSAVHIPGGIGLITIDVYAQLARTYLEDLHIASTRLRAPPKVILDMAYPRS